MRHHAPPRRSATRARFPLALLAVSVGIATLLAWNAQLNARRRGPLLSDAPLRAFRRAAARLAGGRNVIGRAVTINKPRQELYAYWRDFSHLPQFMESVKQVHVLDGKRSRWLIAGPRNRQLGFTSVIVDERPGELIAWRAEADAPVRHSGQITFRDAPGGRGTEVEATVTYDMPGGEAGRFIGKLFARAPAARVRRDLKRFKQLMETGEIATCAPGGPPPPLIQAAGSALS